MLVVFLALPSLSQATNGYFQHGIGVKEQSLGGAAIAYPQSVLSVATNPASASDLGRRFDIGLDFFSPERSTDAGDGSGYHDSKSTLFLIPQFGYSHPFSDKISFALALYANGGLQTDWPVNFFGDTETYSELEQAFFTPTVTYKLTPDHAIGVSVNFIRQTFEVRGLQDIIVATPSGTSQYLTDRGEDASTGWGMRFGYLGQLNPILKVGAFWQPRTDMERFEDYRELLAERGGFDIPETYGIGIAADMTDQFSIAADVVEIKYADIPALGNLNSIGSTFMGTNEGPGFGWKDITVLKLGVEYRYSPSLNFRIGWNHGENPVRSSQTAINIISPATIEDHLTLGFSWMVTKNSQLSMTYWHGFESEVNGQFSAANGADAADIKMFQDNVGIAYSKIFE